MLGMTFNVGVSLIFSISSSSRPAIGILVKELSDRSLETIEKIRKKLIKCAI